MDFRLRNSFGRNVRKVFKIECYLLSSMRTCSLSMKMNMMCILITILMNDINIKVTTLLWKKTSIFSWRVFSWRIGDVNEVYDVRTYAWHHCDTDLYLFFVKWMLISTIAHHRQIFLNYFIYFHCYKFLKYDFFSHKIITNSTWPNKITNYLITLQLRTVRSDEKLLHVIFTAQFRIYTFGKTYLKSFEWSTYV